MTLPTDDVLRQMSAAGLTTLGRFQLRMLADRMGVLRTIKDRDAFTDKNVEAQGAFLHQLLQEGGTSEWASWVRELFEEQPTLASIAERKERSTSFDFAFAVVVKVGPKKFVYRLVERLDFNKSNVRALIEQSSEQASRSSYWLEGIPEPSDMKSIVNRSKLGIPEPDPMKVLPTQAWHDVVQKHGLWMWSTFRHYRVTKIYKASNTAVSPLTFAFVLDDGMCTWMKDPDVSKIQLRMKRITNGTRPNGKPLWEQSNGDAPNGAGLVFTHVEVEEALVRLNILSEASIAGVRAIDADRVRRVASGYERDQVANRPSRRYEEVPVAGELALDNCIKCGLDLRTNKSFVQVDGTEKICGECTAKADPAYAQVTAVTRRRFKVYEVPPPPVRILHPKYDPRPGIDDQGLGFYSPTYED